MKKFGILRVSKQDPGEAACPLRVAVQRAIDTAFDLWQMSHPPRIQKIATTDCQQCQKPAPGWVKCRPCLDWLQIPSFFTLSPSH